REGEEALVRPRLRDLVDHLDAAAPGHVDVEEDNLGLELDDRADRVLDRLRLAEHVHQVAQLGLDARPEDAVVVDDHDRGDAHRFLLTVSSTSVPSPGSLRISARPPNLSMRPIIDSWTPRRLAGIFSTSKPGPRSSMNTRASESSISA